MLSLSAVAQNAREEVHLVINDEKVTIKEGQYCWKWNEVAGAEKCMEHLPAKYGNDTITSVQVPDGHTAVFYTNDFGGRTITVYPTGFTSSHHGAYLGEYHHVTATGDRAAGARVALNGDDERAGLIHVSSFTIAKDRVPNNDQTLIFSGRNYTHLAGTLYWGVYGAPALTDSKPLPKSIASGYPIRSMKMSPFVATVLCAEPGLKGDMACFTGAKPYRAGFATKSMYVGAVETIELYHSDARGDSICSVPGEIQVRLRALDKAPERYSNIGAMGRVFTSDVEGLELVELKLAVKDNKDVMKIRCLTYTEQGLTESTNAKTEGYAEAASLGFIFKDGKGKAGLLALDLYLNEAGDFLTIADPDHDALVKKNYKREGTLGYILAAE